jgi:hypothetical protein
VSVAKAIDVQSARFSAPNLGTMRTFLSDFGLYEAENSGDGVLKMRGMGLEGSVGPSRRALDRWDLFDASGATNVTDIPTMLGLQRGPDAPADFVV